MTSVGYAVEKRKSFYNIGENARSASFMENSIEDPQKN